MANFETFPPLTAMQDWLIHGFTLREPGLDVRTDRLAALARLEISHAHAREAAGAQHMPFIFVNQVHGRNVAIIDDARPSWQNYDADALITQRPGLCLGVFVADCCPVYFVDPVHRCIGLAHSGRKGTELEIATATVAEMTSNYGADPQKMLAVLGPCIRPPDYEVDFPAAIVQQCRAAGVRQIHDCQISTARDLSRYYSYRAEKGQTGRMLAFLAIR